MQAGVVSNLTTTEERKGMARTLPCKHNVTGLVEKKKRKGKERRRGIGMKEGEMKMERGR
jgi:hypothetical protein